MNNNIRTLRTIKGWTQVELAQKCHLSVRTICDLEANRHGLYPKTRFKIIKVLGDDAFSSSVYTQLDMAGAWAEGRSNGLHSPFFSNQRNPYAE